MAPPALEIAGANSLAKSPDTARNTMSIARVASTENASMVTGPNAVSVVLPALRSEAKR